MAGVPKVPAQGDRAKLQQLASGLKRENGTYGAVVQRTPAGRPQGTTGTPAPRASQGGAMPEGFSDSVRELATNESLRSGWGATADYWDGQYAQSPTPFVQMMRDFAVHMATQQDDAVTSAAARVYNTTPNFTE